MYRFLDHTADVAFEVEADDLAGLLREASLAFYEAFTFQELLSEGKVKTLEVEEDSPDYLLFAWLNELLYLFDTEHFAGRSVEVGVHGDDRLVARGKILGDALSPEKVRLEPKAITLHNFRVEKRNGGWYAFVVVDI
ncbi:archease [Geoglobus sp.]